MKDRHPCVIGSEKPELLASVQCSWSRSSPDCKAGDHTMSSEHRADGAPADQQETPAPPGGQFQKHSCPDCRTISCHPHSFNPDAKEFVPRPTRTGPAAAGAAVFHVYAVRGSGMMNAGGGGGGGSFVVAPPPGVVSHQLFRCFLRPAAAAAQRSPWSQQQSRHAPPSHQRWQRPPMMAPPGPTGRGGHRGPRARTGDSQWSHFELPPRFLKQLYQSGGTPQSFAQYKRSVVDEWRDSEKRRADASIGGENLAPTEPVSHQNGECSGSSAKSKDELGTANSPHCNSSDCKISPSNSSELLCSNVNSAALNNESGVNGINGDDSDISTDQIAAFPGASGEDLDSSSCSAGATNAVTTDHAVDQQSSHQSDVSCAEQTQNGVTAALAAAPAPSTSLLPQSEQEVTPSTSLLPQSEQKVTPSASLLPQSEQDATPSTSQNSSASAVAPSGSDSLLHRTLPCSPSPRPRQRQDSRHSTSTTTTEDSDDSADSDSDCGSSFAPSSSVDSADDFICFMREESAEDQLPEPSHCLQYASSSVQPAQSPQQASSAKDTTDGGGAVSVLCCRVSADSSEDDSSDDEDSDDAEGADFSEDEDPTAATESPFDAALWRELSISPMSVCYRPRLEAPAAAAAACESCARAPAHLCIMHRRIADANRQLRAADGEPAAAQEATAASRTDTRVRFVSGDGLVTVYPAPDYDRDVTSHVLDLQRQHDRQRLWRANVQLTLAPLLSAVLTPEHRERILRQRPELVDR